MHIFLMYWKPLYFFSFITNLFLVTSEWKRLSSCCNIFSSGFIIIFVLSLFLRGCCRHTGSGVKDCLRLIVATWDASSIYFTWKALLPVGCLGTGGLRQFPLNFITGCPKTLDTPLFFLSVYYWTPPGFSKCLLLDNPWFVSVSIIGHPMTKLF